MHTMCWAFQECTSVSRQFSKLSSFENFLVLKNISKHVVFKQKESEYGFIEKAGYVTFFQTEFSVPVDWPEHLGGLYVVYVQK